MSWALFAGMVALDSAPFISLGVFILLTVPLSLLLLAALRYQERHKTCPECGNDVLRVARVCQYCGYRWQPPLPDSVLPSS